MTPFLRFRVWLKRASGSQKFSAGAAVVLAIAVLVWCAIPTANSTRATSVGTSAEGALGADAVGGTTSGPGGDSAGGGVSASSAGSGLAGGGAAGRISSQAKAASGGGAGSGGAATAGCTKTGTLKIGVPVPSEAGGSLNQAFGIPSRQEEQADFDAAFDSVNKAGGVACFNLVGDYVPVDGTDTSSGHADCLQLIQDKVFAALPGFLPEFSDDCLLEKGIPTIEEGPIPLGDVKRYFPYYFTATPTFQVLYNNFAHAVDQMGFFSASKHFAKIGVYYRDCIPEAHNALLADLAAVGVSGSRVETADLGCPTTPYASPQVIQEAVLKFKSDGVTTVTTDTDNQDVQAITATQSSYGFKPQWLIADSGIAAVTGTPEFKPEPSNFNGAVAITSFEYGAENSNLPESSATVACDKIMTSHGLPTVYKSGDQYAGSACNLVWMLAAAIKLGGADPTKLVTGLQAAKTVPFSSPDGPNDFSAPGTTWGGQYWRPIAYDGSGCQCWKVVNASWSPSFR